MTGLDLISQAMRLLRSLAVGEIPTAEEAQNSLVILNQLLDSWNSEKLSIFSTNPQTFSLIPGKQAYTIGLASSDFPVPRPARIEKVAIKVTNVTPNLEFVLEQVNQDKWAAISIKQFSSTYPSYVWDNENYPERTLSFWAIPGAGLSVILYTWQALTQFADLTTNYTFPPAYARALRYNLAKELLGDFPAPPDAVDHIMRGAAESKGAMQMLNSESPVLGCDRALTLKTNTKAIDRAAFIGGTW